MCVLPGTRMACYFHIGNSVRRVQCIRQTNCHRLDIKICCRPAVALIWFGTLPSGDVRHNTLLWKGYGDRRAMPLPWRHNERDGVSNHLRLQCLLNCLFRRWSKKTSKPRVTGLCAGNSPVTGEFPAQRASNAEDVSIWWRHHVTIPFSAVKFCRSHMSPMWSQLLSGWSAIIAQFRSRHHWMKISYCSQFILPHWYAESALESEKNIEIHLSSLRDEEPVQFNM